MYLLLIVKAQGENFHFPRYYAETWFSILRKFKMLQRCNFGMGLNSLLSILPISRDSLIFSLKATAVDLIPLSDGAGGWTLDTPTKVDTSDVLTTVDIPAFSLVTENGEIADSSNIFHFGHVVGISTVPVLTGFIDTVVTQGEVTNNLWSWVNNDKLFLNGTTLSTIPPATGFNQFIAIARNNNTIFVRLQQPIRL